jgi:phosphoribosyl-ATP pyrophosphohydrolase/phosphoribosyl-AMP cyclohydrolase
MDFTKLGGLIPAVVQDEISNEVLMVGFMNGEAWRLHARHGLRHLLQPHAAEAVDEG